MASRDKIVCLLVDKHAQKARESKYDRSVARTAISTAREVIAAVPANRNDQEYAASLLSRLHDLMAHYHDPDGVHTSGKGVLGALVNDIHVALSNASD